MADSSSPGGSTAGPEPADLGWASTVTSGAVPGAGPSSSPAAGEAQAGAVQSAPPIWSGGEGAGSDPQVVRHGPGVPAAAASQVSTTAEQVWRNGLPARAAPRGRRARLIASSVLSVALLIASIVVIYLRLHHGPFGVTGVAITGQARNGCTVEVTGRIATTSASGSVSYQWVFASQQAAPRPASQSVAAGQSGAYVTAAIQGRGHGRVTQQVTLQVLGPGHDTASVPVTVSC